MILQTVQSFYNAILGVHRICESCYKVTIL